MINNPDLFIDPHLSYSKTLKVSTFTDHINQCKDIILNTRLDLKQANKEKIIHANLPFEWEPPRTEENSKIGILLIHGLFDSPLHMQDIGEFFFQHHFLVWGILLPGHGTIPGALLSVSYQDWLQTVHFAVEQIAKKVENIIIIGNSTGANLAHYYALQHPNKIRGLILISPALKIKAPLVSIAHLPTYLPWKRMAWLRQAPDETLDYAKYRSVPFNAVYQVYKLALKIKQYENYALPCPLFFVLSYEDAVIDAKKVMQYFYKKKMLLNRMLLYAAANISSHDPAVEIKSSEYPNYSIQAFSHISLPIAPYNHHYGKNGDFCYASHVGQDKHVVYGEYTPQVLRQNRILRMLHLTRTKYERLTFNPDFAYLIQAMKNFIQNYCILQ